MSNFSFPPPPPPPPRAAPDTSHVVNEQSLRGRGRGGFPRGRGPNARGRGNYGSGRGGYASQSYSQSSLGSAYGQHGGSPFPSQNSYNTSSGSQPLFNNAPHGQKRKRGDFPDSRGRGSANHTTSAPKVSVAPAVPAFGAPLFAPPATVGPPLQVTPAQSSVAKKRKTNFLGLTPAGVDYESSSEEEKDEEAHFTSSANALQVTHRGQTISLSSTADIKAWIEERKKRWPTKAKVEARLEEQQKRRAEQDAARQKVIEARKAEQERRRQAVELDRQAKREAEAVSVAGANAAKNMNRVKKQQRTQENGEKLSKEEKQRKKLDKMLAKAEKLRKKLEGGKVSNHDAAQAAPSTSDRSVTHDASGTDLNTAARDSGIEVSEEGPRIILPNTMHESTATHPAPSDNEAMQFPTSQGAVESVHEDPLSLKAQTYSSSEIDSEPDSDSDSDLDIDSDSLSESDLESDVSTDSCSAPEETSTKWDESSELPPRYNLENQQPKSNRVCRYFVSRGTCKAGASCRFRHEMPEKREKSADHKKERKTLLQRMIEQEQAEENRLAAAAIRFLGDKGMLGVFEEGGQDNIGETV